MGGGTGMGGAAGAGAGAGGAIAGGVGPPVAGASGLSPMQALQEKFKILGPQLMGGGKTPEAEEFLTNIARTGPPPQVPMTPQPIQGGLPSASQGIGKALAPPGRGGILPAPRRMPMMRGEALTNPGQGIGNALNRSY